MHIIQLVIINCKLFAICWFQPFYPQSVAPCGASQTEVLYDIATQLSVDGFDQEHTQLMHTTRGTLNIYSRYFMLWANYSTLYLSLLTDPSLAEELEGKVFSSGLPLRQYCVSRACETWQLLSQNMNITVEERVHLVNQTIEHYHMVAYTNIPITCC